MSESEPVPPVESSAAAESTHPANDPAALAAKKKSREMRLAVAIVVLWVVTAASLYIEREHWFGDNKPKMNTAVLNRSSD